MPCDDSQGLYCSDGGAFLTVIGVTGEKTMAPPTMPRMLKISLPTSAATARVVEEDYARNDSGAGPKPEALPIPGPRYRYAFGAPLAPCERWCRHRRPNASRRWR